MDIPQVYAPLLIMGAAIILARVIIANMTTLQFLHLTQTVTAPVIAGVTAESIVVVAVLGVQALVVLLPPPLLQPPLLLTPHHRFMLATIM